MTDFDTIWRTQDEIRTVVNAVVGECIWDLSYNINLKYYYNERLFCLSEFLDNSTQFRSVPNQSKSTALFNI